MKCGFFKLPERTISKYFRTNAGKRAEKGHTSLRIGFTQIEKMSKILKVFWVTVRKGTEYV